jgi:hypothetical protein
VRRLVLPELPVEVVRGEQGIGEGAGQRRVDGEVDDPVLAVLADEERMPPQGAGVLEFLVGDGDEEPERRRLAWV